MIEELYPGDRLGKNKISQRDIEHLLRRHEKIMALYQHFMMDYCDVFPEIIPVAKHLLEADRILLKALENKMKELESNA